jgi:tRNA 2-thiouridine synthesizing protein E
LEVKKMEQALEERTGTPTTGRGILQEMQQRVVMPLIENVEQKKRTVVTAEVDEYGLMLHPERWNREVAQLLAQKEAIGDLGQDHWQVINNLRQYYLEFGIVPPVRSLERNTGLSLRRIYELFPSGLAKGACKVAGMPSDVAMVQGYVDR